ncbi:PHP domain-containing protein [Pseudokineococcus basanitobsidens]|uniref:PHP domain-containing protein n=2 Tax=Pseudokineococcus basanitobsidens TaxID=1926649 RepID=A0ABU8RIK4_9ACTN
MIDLHAHSRASDGTQSPAEVVASARDAGLDVVALTDHDTTAGWDEAAAAATSTGVALVRGTEISCHHGGTSIHLLSYLHDPLAPGLRAELDLSRASRLHRAEVMVARIGADLPLTWDDVLEQVSGDATVGRPHVADALVAKGLARDRGHAFATVLSTRSPYFVGHHAPDAVQAVRLVRAAGGVPVFAHPRAVLRGRVVADEVVAELADAGLVGLEVHHRDHDEPAVRHLADLAGALGLLVTGSSDYHGAGKDNRLGERTTAPEVLEAVEALGTLEVVRG